jgi:hypothetical protein
MLIDILLNVILMSATMLSAIMIRVIRLTDMTLNVAAPTQARINLDLKTLLFLFLSLFETFS